MQSAKASEENYAENTLLYSKKRLANFIGEIESLETLDFPYPSSKSALGAIISLLRPLLEDLKSLPEEGDDEKTVRAACVTSITEIARFLPRVGFILRSTDVRNAFEVYGPLQTLFKQILEEEVKLVLSSEWDYSPHLLGSIPGLEQYIFIGLPASECSNALLIPLAGHELGHAIWAKKFGDSEYSTKLEEIVTDIILRKKKIYENIFGEIAGDLRTDIVDRENWLPCVVWALNHIQESFCDFVGLRIFRESYLHAFSYLLSPYPDPYSDAYPSLQRRAIDLETAATRYGIDVPAGYAASFGKEVDPAVEGQEDAFRLKVANDASSNLVNELIDRVDGIVSSLSLYQATDADITRVYNCYEKFMVPSVGEKSIACITNAGWRAYLNTSLWENRIEDQKERVRTLQDLMLKNLEILEFEQRIDPSDP